MSDYFLADDLSGALDAAAAFHNAGRRVTIALSPEAWPEASADDVVGLTTETRNASPAVAADAVTTAITQARARGARLLYKKIDSTLRGQVAAELAALALAMPEANILFTPANPRVGRTIRNGVLLVHGVPVAETEFARDPVSPVRESSIRTLLGKAGGARVIVADAATEDDLSAAVRRMESLSEPWVAIGSGALARPVAALRARSDSVAASHPPAPPAGPILFVCGSAHRANREQAERLQRETGLPMHEVYVRDVQPVIRAAAESVRRHGAAVLMLETARTDSLVALQAIVAASRAVITETNVTRIFATGGETAFALCREMKIAALTFRAEIEAGLSLSTAISPTGSTLWAVKPGGFGDELTWVRGMHALQG